MGHSHLACAVLSCLLAIESAWAQPVQSRESDLKPAGSEPASTATSPSSQLQLLEGVRLFRAAQYEDALRIFQKIDAEQQPADIGFYLGMVLHKLGRHLPALIAFRSAGRSGLREPVADYYLSVSCYRLGMTARARAGFSTLISGSPTAGTPALPLGPRLQQGARSFLASLAQPSPEPVSEGSGTASGHAEQALRRSERLLQSDDVEGALEWLEEAARSLLDTPERPERALRLMELRQVWVSLRSKLASRSSSTEVQALDKLLAN